VGTSGRSGWPSRIGAPSAASISARPARRASATSPAGRWPFLRPALVLAFPVSRGPTFADMGEVEGWDGCPRSSTPPDLLPASWTRGGGGPDPRTRAPRRPSPPASLQPEPNGAGVSSRFPARCRFPGRARHVVRLAGFPLGRLPSELPRGSTKRPGRTPLMDFSKIPSIDVHQCVHSRRASFPTERDPVRPSLATWSSKRCLPSARACHGSGLVPPLPFLTASTAFSAQAPQVCCTLLPIMGFARFQAHADPVRQVQAEAWTRDEICAVSIPGDRPAGRAIGGAVRTVRARAGMSRRSRGRLALRSVSLTQSPGRFQVSRSVASSSFDDLEAFVLA
jgi:hypothetical protein